MPNEIKDPNEAKTVITYIDLADNPHLNLEVLELVTTEMEIYCREQLNQVGITEPIIAGIKPFDHKFFVGVKTSNMAVYKSEKGQQVALILSNALNRVAQHPIWPKAEVASKREIGFKLIGEDTAEIQAKTDFRLEQIHVLWVYEAAADPHEFDRMKKISDLANQTLARAGNLYAEIKVDYANGSHRFLYTGNKLSEKEELDLIELLRTLSDQV